MTTHKAIREALPPIPAELLHLCETEREAVRRYARQVVQALRPVAMTDEQMAACINAAKTSLFDRDGTTSFRIGRAVEAFHHITQKEQG